MKMFALKLCINDLYFTIFIGFTQYDFIENQLCAELSDVLEDKKIEWREKTNRKVKEQLADLSTEAARQQRPLLEKKYAKHEAIFLKGLAEAERVISWKVYDPNTIAEFFDTTSMFGVTDGFDIAIGNPPYIRHEKIRHLKPDLEIHFGDFFASTADISVYFYKRAAELIRDNGILTYICTNKFLRSDYGENLRKFLTTYMSLQILLDFGNVPAFKAAVDTCITCITKALPANNHSLRAITLRKAFNDFNIRGTFQKQSFPIKLTNLSADVWAVAPPNAQALLKKLKNIGIPLSVCVANRLNMGIKTGCNKAFLIDADTRNKLIDVNSKSEELIKPILKGRTISKWKTDTPNEYLIVIESSANRSWPWSSANGVAAEQIFAEHYPAIFAHLNKYREQLNRRTDKCKFYWELRTCKYYTEFDKPKIIYPDISQSVRASYDTTKMLSLQTAYILPTDDLSLLAILNSRLFEWYAKYRFQSLNDPWAGGGSRFIAQYMKRVPIADRTDEQKAELSQLVEQILADPENKNVPTLEKEIDEIVYQLYELSDTEIALIKQTYKDAGMEV